MKAAESAVHSSVSGEVNLRRTALLSAKEAQEQLDAMNAAGARIQQLLEQLEALPNPSTRELVHEFMEATLGFYGQGLARILQVVRAAGSEGEIERMISSGIVKVALSI
ncbi:MAG TPA: hypothetical protein VJX28_00045 [Chthoniobacterales bacterium]|nr:hypothetical protein [Chthoniobacterales bacterium]